MDPNMKGYFSKAPLYQMNLHPDVQSSSEVAIPKNASDYIVDMQSPVFSYQQLVALNVTTLTSVTSTFTSETSYGYTSVASYNVRPHYESGLASYKYYEIALTLT